MLNPKTNERELAYVARVTEILPIEGADRVEIAKINGWTCMVAKGAFKVNDLGIFFEADAKVPEKEPFLFMEKRHYKVKVQKFFKGTVISDGLLMSFEDFGWEKDKYAEGDFLTKELGITYADAEDNKRKANSGDKYKKMAQRHGKLFAKQPFRWLMKRTWGRKLLFLFFGKKRDKRSAWPSWVVKTDEERIQNLTMKIADFQKEKWIPTEKIDGTSTTATYRRTGRKKHEFYICSRNVVFDKPDKGCYYETNVYTEMAEKYHFEDVLAALVEKYNLEWATLQGETYGAGIQKREYGLKEHDFAGFNLIFSDRGRLNSVEAKEILAEYGIPWVPIVDEHFVLPDTVEELLTIATDKSVIDGGMREGLVFRSVDGAKSFKAVSNEFLMKYHNG